MIDVKKIEKVLLKDAEAHMLTVGELSREVCTFDDECKSIGRCAIGSLLFYGGYKGRMHSANEHEKTSAAAKLLREEYGLPTVLVNPIESMNDNAAGGAEDAIGMMQRYDEVMALVEWAAAMEAGGVDLDKLAQEDEFHEDPITAAYEEGFEGFDEFFDWQEEGQRRGWV